MVRKPTKAGKEEAWTSHCKEKKTYALSKPRKYFGRGDISLMIRFVLHGFCSCLTQRKMRTQNFSGAYLWCRWLSSPPGHTGKAGHRSALTEDPRSRRQSFLPAAPGSGEQSTFLLRAKTRRLTARGEGQTQGARHRWQVAVGLPRGLSWSGGPWWTERTEAALPS